MFFRKALPILLMALLPAYAMNAPRVTVSILPIHSLTSNIMQGIGEPILMIEGNQSPHDFQLRPSQRRDLEQSELVIWVGPSMEGFMRKISDSLPETHHQLILMQDATLSGVLATHSTHEENHDEHGDLDPHIWLSPELAIMISKAISQKLQQIDSANAASYEANTQQLISRLQEFEQSLVKQLDPLKDQRFVVYHDAYGYLVKDFGLNQAGIVTLDEHRLPGAGHLRELRKELVSSDVRCLFTEPQFEPRMTSNLIEGTSIKTATLDPLGAGIEPGPRAYFILMQTLGDSLEECLR